MDLAGPKESRWVGAQIPPKQGAVFFGGGVPRCGPFGWRRGVVVSGVCRVNEVNARRARLVPGWVTVFGRVYDLGM